MRSLGIPAREDSEGRVYPFSESAPGVAEIFTDQLKALGVKLQTNTTPVRAISVEKDCFADETEKNSFGKSSDFDWGKAGPDYGCSGDGYTLAKALGHNVTKTLPVLTGICWICRKPAHPVKELSLICRDRVVFFGARRGTVYGLRHFGNLRF